MPGHVNEETGNESHAHHIEVVEEDARSDRGDNQPTLGSPSLRDSKGWDGKLRIDRNATIQNPEALTDPEYSDEENVLEGQEISADEGIFHSFIQVVYSLSST